MARSATHIYTPLYMQFTLSGDPVCMATTIPLQACTTFCFLPLKASYPPRIYKEAIWLAYLLYLCLKWLVASLSTHVSSIFPGGKRILKLSAKSGRISTCSQNRIWRSFYKLLYALGSGNHGLAHTPVKAAPIMEASIESEPSSIEAYWMFWRWRATGQVTEKASVPNILRAASATFTAEVTLFLLCKFTCSNQNVRNKNCTAGRFLGLCLYSSMIRILWTPDDWCFAGPAFVWHDSRIS